MNDMEALEGRFLLAATALAALPDGLVELGPDTRVQPLSIGGDSLGNFYVAGTFAGKFDFNLKASRRFIVDGGTESLFLARYSAAGGLYWVTTLRYADGTTPQINSVAVDKSGDLYVGGQFTKAPKTGTPAGQWVIPNYDEKIQTISTVWKIRQNGSLTWSNSIVRQTNNRYSALHIAVDRLGRVYETGNVVTNPGSDFRVQFEVSRLSADRGRKVWTTNLADDFPLAIAVDRHDDPWIAAQAGLANQLVHYSTSGKIKDSIDFASKAKSGLVAVGGIAFDRDDDIITSGGVIGAFDFDPGPGEQMLGTPEGDEQLSNFYISKITPVHKLFFGQVLGAVGKQDTSPGVSVDKSGVIRVAGVIGGVVDFNGRRSGTFVVDPENQQDLFVADYDAKGRFLSAQTLPRSDSREDIAGTAFAAGRTLVLAMFRRINSPNDGTLIWEVKAI